MTAETSNARGEWVLERLRGVLEHGKMGDKCLIAPDLVTAAIAALSAPQPPAEAQPVAWEWEYIGGDHYPRGHKVARSLREMDPTNPPYPETWRPTRPLIYGDTAPPSAPVGVDTIRDGRAIVDEFLQCASIGRPHGKLIAQAKDWLADAEAALTKQPAAVDGDKPYPAPRNRQEAAALAKLALAYLGVTSAHIDAAVARCETDLAGQPGGSDNDR